MIYLARRIRWNEFVALVTTMLLVVFLSGCSGARVSKEIPVSDQEFSLSQDELIEKYPAIVAYDLGTPKPGGDSIKLKLLQEKWGAPQYREEAIPVDRFSLYGAMAASGYVITHGSYAGAGVFLAATGLIDMAMPHSIEIQYWQRGNYQIDAIFEPETMTKHRFLAGWKWSAINSDGTTSYLVDPSQLQDKSKNMNYFYSFIFSTGGDLVNDPDGPIRPVEIGYNSSLEIGRVFRHDEGVRSKVSIARTCFYLFTFSNDCPLISYPIRGVFLYPIFNSKLSFGVGLGYSPDTKVNMVEKNGDVTTHDFDANMSWSYGIEYSVNPKSSFSLRNEVVNYRHPEIGSIDGTTTSLYLTIYF